MEIQWTEVDSENGGKLYYRAERHAGFWKFRVRTHRRGDSKRVQPTRDMWETVLENLERRYRRREGVDDEDLEQVRGILTELKDAPAVEER